MKTLINVFALLLIVFGIITVSYAGFTYTTKEEVAQIGSVTISNEEEKRVPFSPILGGVCMAVGIAILVANRMRR